MVQRRSFSDRKPPASHHLSIVCLILKAIAFLRKAGASVITVGLSAFYGNLDEMSIIKSTWLVLFIVYLWESFRAFTMMSV